MKRSKHHKTKLISVRVYLQSSFLDFHTRALRNSFDQYVNLAWRAHTCPISINFEDLSLKSVCRKIVCRLSSFDVALLILPSHVVLFARPGNALGYIRMVRSGGLSHCSRAIKFVPDLDAILSFQEMSTAANLSEETIIASKYDFWLCFTVLLVFIFRNAHNRHPARIRQTKDATVCDSRHLLHCNSDRFFHTVTSLFVFDGLEQSICDVLSFCVLVTFLFAQSSSFRNKCDSVLSSVYIYPFLAKAPAMYHSDGIRTGERRMKHTVVPHHSFGFDKILPSSSNLICWCRNCANFKILAIQGFFDVCVCERGVGWLVEWVDVDVVCCLILHFAARL
jgi:hypothetical protein